MCLIDDDQVPASLDQVLQATLVVCSNPLFRPTFASIDGLDGIARDLYLDKDFPGPYLRSEEAVQIGDIIPVDHLELFIEMDAHL